VDQNVEASVVLDDDIQVEYSFAAAQMETG
jgi:hypothetical protein